MRARKRFGQHFLHDTGVLDRIAAAVNVRPGDAVLEIGPGRGALTETLTGVASRYVAIEIDRNLAPFVRQRFPRIEVVTGDVLKLPLDELLSGERWRVVGNLPYNITSPVLLKLLGQLDAIRDMHFMIQREVALRLAADPGNKAWGRLTVMVRHECDVIRLFDVAPGSFTPPPAVQSSVIRVLPRAGGARADSRSHFEEVVRHAFSQRRKRMANALRGLGVDFDIAQVDPGLRADALSVDDFVRLANTIGSKRIEEG
ncbi:MAG: 16S rRNA (adenine(1518)-N(6)/adenine(1519)-N(6))-dimethyltransferase RsmA [Pseudomonadales bacterium]|jgi:16S rRNA (adenine1518-N6/adenine1519-N6)-dimethyltransferase|nr:16S rRNA (adenine(1518)-N(6)/adenine(1519)-N(6))-dimethyltransferase RsmA [Pseudomonadales bacterium]MDP6470780.1 16S rRNA (adenine(1518)-N(6)/adenine(1519)-N(6))-dimethyltransferase RsmA [Pseudomonadales bacterium]MDP6828268.1 16S rRNA (adenine(1518)-N(6)/adenine(1519)-N(6))-dimethyltransferase RsmA [Pseudomonadales bacterium]MDP6973012.1 16S rRNA (adenine(1518)-N(6)/adenine(1519)-N(6))-dimethyltransferase RsmA [Pseudomonadales bacterium]